jgi:hypothetical protein
MAETPSPTPAEDQPQGQLILPFHEREAYISHLTEWIKNDADNTLMVLRYPKPGTPRPGVFMPLGSTVLYCVEVNGGERDGHEYWKRGRGWRLQVRWHSLQWVFNYLMRREDSSGLRQAVIDGDMLFDRTGLMPTLLMTAKTGVGFRMVTSRELFRHKVELADAIDALSDMLAKGGSPDEPGIQELFHHYMTAIRVGSRITGGEDAALAIAGKIGMAAQSRAHYNAAARELQVLLGKLVSMAGGRPPGEWYAPISLVHLMPPRPGAPEQGDPEKTPAPEVHSCPDCCRKFVINTDPNLKLPGTDLISIAEPPPETIDGRVNPGLLPNGKRESDRREEARE